jgi:hypothetical protein
MRKLGDLSKTQGLLLGLLLVLSICWFSASIIVRNGNDGGQRVVGQK